MFVPVPTLASHQLLVFLIQVGLLLVTALCLGRLAARFGMPAIVGELLVGVVLGPSLLGHLAPDLQSWLFPVDREQAHLLDAVAQIGVLLLVGITGAHLDLAMVRRRRRSALSVSLAGLLIPLTMGIALGYYLPAPTRPDSADRITFALFLGVAMCVSAIPVIAKTLSDMKLLHRDVSQLTLAAGMIDDAVGWLLLSVVAAMAADGLTLLGVGLPALNLVLFLLAATTLGRPLVRFAFRLANRSEDAGPSIALATAVVLGGAALTHALQLEAVLGAFAAGILVAQSGAAEPTRLAPLRSVVMWVLAPLFLATAGLRMDLTLLARPEVAVGALAVLAVAIVGKFAGAFLGARLSSLTTAEGLALGAGMNARGVVEVVVAMVGFRLGVIGTEAYTIIVLVAIVTSLMAPPLLRSAMRRIEHSDEEHARESAHDQWTPRSAPPAAA
ncbi:cation:proton antiporter [Nocardia sp. bgisy134]|uniref:cation:proton antiporter n=1 Tax=Nocardia sp. bgisy134 TaxID=3413789 RepID=UPI003D72D01C